MAGRTACSLEKQRHRGGGIPISAFLQSIIRVKSTEQASAELGEEKHGLKRVLGPMNLVALGIGAVIGAGIFATVGTAAAGDALRPGAGPAIILSFLVTAVACGFAALCYAEFASMVPISGSAYTYAYATLGELVAWIIGWDLIIEYAVGNIAVAISWSGYFCDLMRGIGVNIPLWLATDMRTAMHTPEVLAAAPSVLGVPIVFNLPAVAICLALTAILVVGVRESARFNMVMVGIKLLVLGFFVFVGVQYVEPANWHPFWPNGWTGIRAGAAIVFFAYIGFDAVSTAAEETRNPARNMPIGIIGSLIACTLIYIVVAGVVTGLVPSSELNVAEPLTVAFNRVGLGWASGIVAFGAVVANTAVLLVFMMGQPRIFFSMARDGLLPPVCARIHPRFRTPHVTTIVTGLVTAFFAAFASIDEMVDLTNIGTLFAFLLVCIGIIILRKREPDRERPFRCPWVPWVPLAGAFCCFYLALGLPAITWWRFAVWLIVGMFLYFAYGFRRSVIARPFRPRLAAEAGA
jgi:basic amino acid/polyamine antiporter, APA family